MEPLISLVNKAIAAFKRNDYAEVVLLLDQAFEYVEAMDYTAMDARIYNAMYDACEMLQLILKLAIFEKADFHQKVFQDFKSTLDLFTSEQGGTLAQLKAVMPNFLLLLRGMSVGIQYLQHRQLPVDAFPPMISFEVTAEGRIRLYAWNDEEELRIADIEALRAEFDELFLQDERQLDEKLAEIKQLQSQQLYKQAIAIVDKAMSQHESFKMDGYLLKGDLLYLDEQYSEAVDAYMKARVLGCPKHNFIENAKNSCQFLIRNATTREERMEWTKLLQNFF